MAAAARGAQLPQLAKAMPMARKLAYRNLFHDRLSLLVTLVGIVFSVVLVAVQCSIYLGSEIPHRRRDGSYRGRPVGGPGRHQELRSSDAAAAGPREARRPLDARRAERRGPRRQLRQLAQVEPGRPDKTGCATETGSAGHLRAAGRLRHRRPARPALGCRRQGSLADLSTPNAVAVDSTYFRELGGRADRRPRRDQRDAGDGQGRDAGDPLLHDAALHLQPASRWRARCVDASPDQATYTLVQVAPGTNIEQVRKSLQARLPDAEVLTHDEFRKRSLDYWLFETGAGSGLIAGAVLAIIVGIVVVRRRSMPAPRSTSTSSPPCARSAHPPASSAR